MSETQKSLAAWLAPDQSGCMGRTMGDNVKIDVQGRVRRLAGAAMLAGWLGASALFAALPAAAQTASSPPLLQNGAVNNRANQWEYGFYGQPWGYNFYFGSEDQGTYEDGELHAWNVQGNVWLITGLPDQNNVVVQIGNDGVLVVDTGTTEMAPKLLALIKKLTAQHVGDHKDIRWVINTNGELDHVGGNEVIRKAGRQIKGISLGASDVPGATMIASQDTLTRMVTSGVPEALLPSEAHEGRIYSWYFNDEAVTLNQPRHSNTNGALLVQFRRSDVLAIGDLVTYDAYPKIDVDNGGTIDGLLTALHDALDLTVAGYHNGPVEGGTMIIPGHGRLIDRVELLHYIYVVQTLRNRIMYYKNRGKTLQEVLDMNVTWDFDGRWAKNSDSKNPTDRKNVKNAKNSKNAAKNTDRKSVGRTPQDFVKAVYETLPAASSTGPDRFFIPDEN